MTLALVINGGSSSLKFQLFDQGEDRGSGQASETPLFRGLFEGLAGSKDGAPARAVIKDGAGSVVHEASWQPAPGKGHEQALERLFGWGRDAIRGRSIAGVGHRVVHGGPHHANPVLVTDAILDELEALSPLAPLHQPHNLGPIRIIRAMAPGMPQVACFDTAFHRSQPAVAQQFAVPREITDRGVLRYGFHGLSYEYVASAMGDYDPRLSDQRVVVCHLGNGASACALQAGRSVASTMGFSALDGLMMGTRCGSIDPGAVFYLMRDVGMSPAEAEQFLYTKCGLLGVSGLSNDMRTLREKAPEHPRAREALAMYVYRIVREVGSLAAALGGIDALVFTAGIGENDAATRAEVMAGLGFLGFALDPAANAARGPRISSGTGPSAWVIPTNEELTIARHMAGVLRNPA